MEISHTGDVCMCVWWGVEWVEQGPLFPQYRREREGIKKSWRGWGDPNTPEVKAGGFLRVLDQPDLQSKTLSQTKRAGCGGTHR